MATVSVCIPTYNRKAFLKQALESLKEQTFRDFETIVLDDGSADGTGQMVKDCGFDVKYYRQENKGEAATTNKLIELAESEYISFLHSDDLLFPDTLERLVEAARAKQEYVIVYGNYVKIDQDGRICGTSTRQLHSGYITRQLFEDIIVHPVGSLFPKKALIEAGGLNTSLRACYDYQMELIISLKYRFIALDEPTFKRRRHSTNISQISFANRKTEMDMLKDFYYNRGGREVIPEVVALRRISREAYRAGRSALRENLLDQADELLRESCRLNLTAKAMLYRTWVTVRKTLS